MSVEYILHLLLFLSLGGLGAAAATKIKLPAGVFIGPVVFVGAYQVAFGAIMPKPNWLRLAVQIGVGVVLGSQITNAFLQDLKRLIKPALLVSLTLFGGAVLLGVILRTVSGWDLMTCILATAPGGQSDMALISDSVGAQTEKVIVLQLIRNQLALVVLMPIARSYLKARQKRGPDHDL